MPESSCNVDNVMGKLGAVMDAGGVEMTNGAFEKLTGNAKLLYQQTFSGDKSSILEVGKPKTADKVDQVLNATTQDISEGSRPTIKGVVLGSMKPTDILPKEVTDPILTYIDDFYVINGGDIKGKSGQFIAGMKGVINNIDDSKVPNWAESEWNHWRRDLLDGHPFYEAKGNDLTSILNNTVANSINLSNNVIMGNPVELLVKAPTLYGFRPSLAGLVEALKTTKGNIWARIPELEKRGYYGFNLEPSKRVLGIPGSGKLNDLGKQSIELIMNTTQRPLLNTAYSIGKLKGGEEEGILALEKIAFANRLGNRPRLFRSQSSGSSLKLMNYTFSQYQMMGGLIHGLGNPETRWESVRGIATYGLMVGALGGQSAYIPKPFDMILEQVDGYKDWRAEHLTPLGKLIQPGQITVGAAQSIWNRTTQSANKDFQSGANNLSKGNVGAAVCDFTLGSLQLSIGFGQNVWTNPRILKSIRANIDLLQGDIGQEEAFQRLDKTWNPFHKDE